MRYKVLTVKLPEDTYADLEAYALQEFPDDCRKCQGSGEYEGRMCPYCGGTGIKGNLSEASRYLLHYALGEGSSPEARAMAAAYADFRSKFVAVLTQLMHSAEQELKREVVRAVREMIHTGP